MAMGDLNSVEFGQEAHAKLAIAHGLATRGSLVTMHGVWPRGEHAVGIVIDDLVLFELTLRQSARSPLCPSPAVQPSLQTL